MVLILPACVLASVKGCFKKSYWCLRAVLMEVQVQKVPSFDAKLSDICIGTSAAPTYLPPYYFQNDGTEFNLIDGGVAATNPAMAAVTEVIKQQKEKNPEMTPTNSNENTKILLLSIGCGTVKAVGYDAQVAEQFSAAVWAGSGLATGAYDYTSKDMTEFYISTVFPGLQSSDYYLRIQGRKAYSCTSWSSNSMWITLYAACLDVILLPAHDQPEKREPQWKEQGNLNYAFAGTLLNHSKNISCGFSCT
ncbi:hypothetical protein VNO80_01949 [Phaseolus coccineus]|uniref:Patatin n=1 Tax=Phaseolus coccineus TaxID=3886 RepID=A0AAN9WXX0_PHACN